MFCKSEGALTSKTNIDSHWGGGRSGSCMYLRECFKRPSGRRQLRMQTRGYLLR